MKCFGSEIIRCIYDPYKLFSNDQMFVVFVCFDKIQKSIFFYDVLVKLMNIQELDFQTKLCLEPVMIIW